MPGSSRKETPGKDLLGELCERGTRPVPYSPLSRTGTSGKVTGKPIRAIIWQVFSSPGAAGLGSALCETPREVSDQRWKKGSYSEAPSSGWRVA